MAADNVIERWSTHFLPGKNEQKKVAERINEYCQHRFVNGLRGSTVCDISPGVKQGFPGRLLGNGNLWYLQITLKLCYITAETSTCGESLTKFGCPTAWAVGSRPWVSGICYVFWGCITYEGVGTLVPVDGNINSQNYMQILHAHLWPVVAKHFGDKPFIFQDDNAPAHSSKFTRDGKLTSGQSNLT